MIEPVDIQRLLGIKSYPPIPVDEKWKLSDKDEAVLAKGEWEAFIRQMKEEQMALREKGFREARRKERAEKKANNGETE